MAKRNAAVPDEHSVTAQHNETALADLDGLGEQMSAGNPVVVKTTNPVLARLLVPPDAGLDQCATDIDVTTPEGRMLVFNCTADSALRLDESGTIEVDAEHYMVHPVPTVDEETGEERQVLRVVFIQPDGQTYSTFSDVIIHRLAQLLSLFDGMRWDGVLRLRIQEMKARRSKRTYHNLTIVPKE